MQQAHQIIIIGGHGQMGQLFSRLLIQRGHRVTPFGESDWSNAQDILPEADLVIICVPIAVTEKIIQQAAHYLKPTAVLADLTSTKVTPMAAMLSAHLGPVLGLHPMFGPTIDKPDNSLMIYCDGRQPEQYHWLLQDLRELRFTVQGMSAEQHDRAMDLVQGLQHFITYCTGVFLKNQGVAIQELLQIGSPLYQLQLNMLGRIFYQDAGLYADIIASDPKRLALLQQFVTSSAQLLTQVQQGKKCEFIDQFQSVTQWMGDFSKQAQDKTDQLFNRA